MNSIGLYALAACLVALIGTSWAISCYQCSTSDPDQFCEDPFDGSKYFEPCDKKREHNNCRKVTTIQYAVRTSGDTEEVGRTVSRFCGGPEDTTDCEVIEGDASKTYNCVCNEDGCNASGIILANISTIMAMLAAAMLGKLLC